MPCTFSEPRSQGVSSSCRTDPRIDFAHEYEAAGQSYQAARDTVARDTARHRELRRAEEETMERERRHQQQIATFAETRLATCGEPTLNSINVRIERQRAKAKANTSHGCKPVLTAATPCDGLQTHVRAAVRRAYHSQALTLTGLHLVRLPSTLVFSTLLLQLARTIRTVNVSCNALRDLDETILRVFPELETLNCKDNALTQLPARALQDLRFLHVLNVSGNQLVELASELPASLTTLDASRNRLYELVNGHTLTNLVTLELSHNHLHLLPCGLQALSTLESLVLATNRLVTLATRPPRRFKRANLDDGNELFNDDKQDARHQWRIEQDPLTNESVFFHIPSQCVTRVVPKCFQVRLPMLPLPGNGLRKSDQFSLGWEIIVPSSSDPSTALCFVNHLTRETMSTLPLALDHWEGMAHLRLLVLSNNQLVDLPSSIGHLKHLKHLEIDHNKLLALPDVLQGLEALERLNASFNRLSRLPPSFSNLRNLKDVDLKVNNLPELPSTIGSLQHLRLIDVSSNALEDLPDSLIALTRLETLRIDGNVSLSRAGFTTEIMQLTEFAALRWHLMHKRSIVTHGGLPPEPRARVIGIGAECWSTDLHLRRAFLRAIERAKDTQTLSLHWHRMEPLEFPSVFFTLSQLQELRLSGQQVTVLPAQFAIFSNLRLLELRMNQICVIAPDVFGAKKTPLLLGVATKVESLDFCFNRMQQLPETVEHCGTLQVLRVSHNVLDSLPKSMHGLAHTLVDLQLAHNQLNGCVQALSGLKALQRLDLSFNRLATLEMDFSQLENLQVLRLSGNRLTELPMSLRVPPIQKLSFAGNKVVHFPPVVLLLGSTLQQLDMQMNCLDHLPLEFGSALATLTDFKSEGNPLRSPPAQVLRLGVKVIHLYLRKRQERVEELAAVLDALGLYYDRTAFDRQIVQHLLPSPPTLPFLTSDHLTAFDRAVDCYVNGPFYLPPSVENRPSFRRGIDLCHELLLMTHFKLAQAHHRTVLNELLQLLSLIREKRYADKTELRYDLQRPWGRRGELISVYTVRQSLLFPPAAAFDADSHPRELPSIVQVIETRTQRGFPPEPFVAHQRTLQDVVTALEEYVGPYGPVGIVHDNVPLRCACSNLLRYGKMHDPCRQRGWTIVSILYTDEESGRREADDQDLQAACADLRPSIRTFLESLEGQQHFFHEVKRIKETLRTHLRTLQKQLKRHRTAFKLLVQRSKQQEQNLSETLATTMARRKKLELARACVQDDQIQLKRGKARLGQGYTAFRREVEHSMVESACVAVRQQLVRQQRDKAIAMGWRRPWDGRDGRAFERYRREIDRRKGGDDDGEDASAFDRGVDKGTGEGDAWSDDNSEISDVSFHESDHAMGRMSQEAREEGDTATRAVVDDLKDVSESLNEDSDG